ncbi:hypothetical protein GQ457_03G039960 [Hibiscus cannabinus]
MLSTTTIYPFKSQCKNKIEIAIIVWAIWFVRNKFYHEGIPNQLRDCLPLSAVIAKKLNLHEFPLLLIFRKQTLMLALFLQVVSSSFEAEALAVVHGLLFVLDLSFRHVILEGSEMGIALNFMDCIFNFIHRSGNKVVHAITALGRSKNVDWYWIEDASSPALELFSTDR